MKCYIYESLIYTGPIIWPLGVTIWINKHFSPATSLCLYFDTNGQISTGILTTCIIWYSEMHATQVKLSQGKPWNLLRIPAVSKAYDASIWWYLKPFTLIEVQLNWMALLRIFKLPQYIWWQHLATNRPAKHIIWRNKRTFAVVNVMAKLAAETIMSTHFPLICLQNL